MVVVERCKRSTLTLEDGMLQRVYHDTERTSDPFPPTVDDKGVERCSGNRRIDTLVRNESTFRGGASRPPPPYLRNALATVCRGSSDIRLVSRLLGVTCNTAWSYVCRVVEEWPTSHQYASRLVHPELLVAVRDETDRTGSLRELMQRLHPRISHISDLRMCDDRYAQLRLARLCVEAES